MSQNDWLVRLPVFQGPLDLLLFLVRRAELDIHDIPIHTLTDEYLEYVRHLSRVDIDLADEFLVMAATLVEIKSRSLAPAQVADEGDPAAPAAPVEDQRAELIRQLLDRALSNTDDNLAADLTAIHESFGALRDADSPDRSPGAREEHLDRIWHRTS